jgi:DNA-binding Xre family transcriptional regulator
VGIGLNLYGFLGLVERADFYESLALNDRRIALGTRESVLCDGLLCLGAWGMVPAMAKQVRLTLAKAIAKANLGRAEVGEKPITMNSLAVQAGVAATTITRLARTDDKAASALSLDLAGKIVTVLDCGIEDLLEVVEG